MSEVKTVLPNRQSPNSDTPQLVAESFGTALSMPPARSRFNLVCAAVLLLGTAGCDKGHEEPAPVVVPVGPEPGIDPTQAPLGGKVPEPTARMLESSYPDPVVATDSLKVQGLHDHLDMGFSLSIPRFEGKFSNDRSFSESFDKWAAISSGPPCKPMTVNWDSGLKLEGNLQFSPSDYHSIWERQGSEVIPADGEKVKLTFPNGDYLEGKFAAGGFCGKMTWKSKSGEVLFDGRGSLNKISEINEMLLPDGTKFEGELTISKLVQGTGSSSATPGSGYAGYIPLINMQVGTSGSGNGTITFPDGASYQGEYWNGVYSGPGTYTWGNGASLKIDWTAGVPTGQGEFKAPDGKFSTVEYDRTGTLVSAESK